MKNKSSDRKPRLNKKQRAWVNSFVSSHPNARVRNIYDSLDGDRVVEIEWWENTNPVILDEHTHIRGRISYQIRVKLRKFGDVRKTAEFSYRITPPEKQTVSYRLTGQLCLELPQFYRVMEPTNPVIVKPKQKAKTAKKVKKFVQQTLPLSGITAQLNAINLQEGGVALSEQELLLETISHLDLNTVQEVKLPAAIIKILKEKKASLKESETAISLYQVAGPTCVLEYLQQLDSWRKYLDTQPVESHTIKNK